MDENNKVLIDGTAYYRELARLEKPAEMIDNEHGGVAIALEFKLASGAHQNYCPSFSLKHKNDLAGAAHFYWRLRAFPKGWTGYVLRENRNDYIRGVQDAFDEKHVFITATEFAKIERLP